MNLVKAREYFSAYYEGSLERGLKQAFEQQLHDDAQLQAEFRAFERTMDQLGGLSREEVEVPSDLHERIKAKLDRHMWEEKQQRKATPVFGWWRAALVGAVAVSGFAFAILKLGGPSEGAEANVTGIGTPSAPELKINPGESGSDVKLKYPADSENRTIIIRDQDGNELQKVDLRDKKMDKPLVNSGSHTQLLSIELLEGTNRTVTHIALPGSVRNKTAEGSGTLNEFAVALAGFYMTPVVIKAQADQRLSWNLTDTDPLVAGQKVLDGLAEISIEKHENQLVISKH